MTGMTISVAMATYNGAAYLKGQLDSIRSQTRLPSELVICDDCSSDSTIELATEFATRAPFRVRIVRNDTRLGITKNFEKSIGLCTGDFIALSDQDDIWLPEKLERLCSMLERTSDLGGVFSDARLIDHESNDSGTTLWKANMFRRKAQVRVRGGDMFSAGVTRMKALGCTMVFRAELVDKIIPIPERWEHDGWISWITAMYSRIDIIPEQLMCYRIHPAQACGAAAPSLADLMRDRADVDRKYARNLIDLCDRLGEKNSPKGRYVLPRLREFVEYLRIRSSLPSGRLDRVGLVMRNLPSYRQFGSGWLSALKDITR
jgi:glycosyltransferase involved in cell wall biosynthesis